MKKKFSRHAKKAAKAPSAAGTPRLLPEGFEAAAPIKNKKRLKLLSGPDITSSGGTHTFANGKPLLRRQTVHG